MMGCFRTVATFAVGRDREKKLNSLFFRRRQRGEPQLLKQNIKNYIGLIAPPSFRATARGFFSYEAFSLFAAQRFFMSTDSRLRPAAVRW